LRRLALAVVFLGVACGAPPQPSPAPASPAGATTWHPLGTWSGRGDRQTESFEVTTGALRLTWETRAASTGAGTFRVALHSAISGRPLQTIVERQGYEVKAEIGSKFEVAAVRNR